MALNDASMDLNSYNDCMTRCNVLPIDLEI